VKPEKKGGEARAQRIFASANISGGEKKHSKKHMICNKNEPGGKKGTFNGKTGDRGAERGWESKERREPT